jgi:hypothetical protein
MKGTSMFWGGVNYLGRSERLRALSAGRFIARCRERLQAVVISAVSA